MNDCAFLNHINQGKQAKVLVISPPGHLGGFAITSYLREVARFSDYTVMSFTAGSEITKPGGAGRLCERVRAAEPDLVIMLGIYFDSDDVIPHIVDYANLKHFVVADTPSIKSIIAINASDKITCLSASLVTDSTDLFQLLCQWRKEQELPMDSSIENKLLKMAIYESNLPLRPVTEAEVMANNKLYSLVFSSVLDQFQVLREKYDIITSILSEKLVIH